ncbi:MAG: translation initiation factor [Planctomycetaceae bacterium]|nr:translation initiation factor [Planctomycetaceae bacterium]MCA9043689.1 translation initiation factor [Planctomycetaceae bacterium]MCB9950489.1 translation initiation factor [Planctomycetaceae bacterium]
MGLFSGTPFDRPPHCPVCDELEEECTCPEPEPFRLAPEKQTARLAVEKRKKGKVVTVVRGLPEEGNDLPALLTQVKNHCGCGGTLDGETLEIQGDQLSRVETFLKSLGFRTRR